MAKHDGKDRDDADGDGSWMTDDDPVVVLDQCAQRRKEKPAPEPEPELPEQASKPGVCVVLRLCLCWEGGWGRRREEGCAMNPCDCKRPESQGSSWRGGVLVAFPFLADPLNGENGSVPIENLAGERANVPGCRALARPDSGPEHSALSTRRDGREGGLCRLSSLVSRPSSVVCRLCRLWAEKRWRINWGPRKSMASLFLSFFFSGRDWPGVEEQGTGGR